MACLVAQALPQELALFQIAGRVKLVEQLVGGQHAAAVTTELIANPVAAR